MREMKDSGVAWLGEIPETWEVAYPKTLFSLRKDRATAGERQLTASQQLGIIYQDEYMATTGQRVVVVEKDFSILKHVEAGDFVISMRSFQGGLEYSTVSGSISSAYVMLIPNNNLVYSPFFKWLFKSVGYIKALQSTSDLIRDGQAMRYSNFIQVPLFVAPIEEQKVIAHFLEKKCFQIDSLIANQEAQIENLKAYKQSLITEVVTKGLDKDAPMKDSGVEWIGKIPESWDVVPLKTLFDFGKGLPITKENLVEEGIPVISYGQIHAKWNSGVTIHEELKRFVGKEYLETNPSCLVKKGDFIIADTSEDREGCGNAAYVDTDDTIFAGYHTVVLISKKPNVDNKYLAYLFLTDVWRSQLRKRVSGIKVFSVSRKFLSETSVLVPDNASKMVELLDEKCSHIDKLITIKQQKIEKLNQYKKSLIYEYVTGKKEVPQ